MVLVEVMKPEVAVTGPPVQSGPDTEPLTALKEAIPQLKEPEIAYAVPVVVRDSAPVSTTVPASARREMLIL
jgi:hypothetical protein